MAIIGGRVVDPYQNLSEPRTVLIEGNHIAALVTPAEPIGGEWEKISAEGKIVCPGFIDLHTHLREPGEEWKETVKTGTLAAARGGFTTVCAMPNTVPAMDSPAILHRVAEIVRNDALVNVLPVAAITIGRKGSELSPMHALAEAGAVAFSDDGASVSNPIMMRIALSLAASLGLPVINHAEDPALVNGGVMHEGEISTRLGLPGNPGESEAVMVVRDIHLAELEGCKLHIPHVSSLLSTEHIRAAKDRGAKITAEVTPHHLTMTDKWVMGEKGNTTISIGLNGYDSNTRVNPPLRSEQDRAALVAALAGGVIDAIATDHAPHSLIEKEGSFSNAAPGINGLETAFSLSFSLVDEGKITLETLIARLTLGPASVLGLRETSLAKGNSADIVVIDIENVWTVHPEKFASKSSNTPLDGVALRGKIVKTFCKGKIVYQGDDHF